jgi:uncharacterized protein (TIGR00106 family)
MLAELTITLLGRGTHMSANLADILKIVDQSQLAYRLTPFGTCIEGEWDELMPLMKHCHERARELSDHVFTTIRLEDEEGALNKLSSNISSIERAYGHPLSRQVVAG